ncbi:MAG: YceI family protein [Bacteroidia bacterium]|nr:YceI family protein [Bacteroidia bacterium]
MKLNLLLLAGAAFLATSCAKAPEAQDAGAADAQNAAAGSGKTYAVQVAQSQVAWVGTKVTGRHNGIFPVANGSFTFDGTTITGGSFEIAVNNVEVKDLKGEMQSKLTGHLKSPDFFDAEKFPTAKFEVTSVTPEATDSTTHRINGNLTLRGVTKNISFGAKVTPEGEALKAHAVFNINRQDWGIAYTGKKDDLIADQVNLTIDLVAQPNAEAAPAAEAAESK